MACHTSRPRPIRRRRPGKGYVSGGLIHHKGGYLEKVLPGAHPLENRWYLEAGAYSFMPNKTFLVRLRSDGHQHVRANKVEVHGNYLVFLTEKGKLAGAFRLDLVVKSRHYYRASRVVTTARESPSLFLVTRSKLLFLLVTKFMSQDQHQHTRTLEASRIVHAQLLQLGKMLLLLVENGEAARKPLGVTDLNKKTPPSEELGRAS